MNQSVRPGELSDGLVRSSKSVTVRISTVPGTLWSAKLYSSLMPPPSRDCIPGQTPRRTNNAFNEFGSGWIFCGLQAQVMRLDVGLEVGSNSETVTVTAEAS